MTGPTITTEGSSLVLSVFTHTSDESHSSQQQLLEVRERPAYCGPTSPRQGQSFPVSEVEVPPPLRTYAQLAFNQAQDQLITVLVRTTTTTTSTAFSSGNDKKKYVSLQEDTELDLPLALSQSLSYSSSSSDDNDEELGFGGGMSFDGSWSCSGSSKDSDGSNSLYDFDFDTSPQEIVWLDETWLYESSDASDNSDIHVSLLHDYAAYGADDRHHLNKNGEMMGGCAKFLRAFCSTNSSNKRQRSGQRNSGSGGSSSPKNTKHFAYNVLN